MMYELEGYNTDTRKVEYRAYTTSKRKADAFQKVPKIQFTDCGHGIIFTARVVTRKRDTLNIHADHVRKHMEAGRLTRA